MGERDDHRNKAPSGRVPAPATLKAFPDAAKAKPKSYISGSKKLRTRWKDPKAGRIYEWDSLHGRVEAYDARGHHLGEFDPDDGRRLGPPDPSRKVEP